MNGKVRYPPNRKFETTPERSRIMASIRYKETWHEVVLRRELWNAKIRNYRKYPRLPGKPDLLFPRYKLVVFADGCFWHGCPQHFRAPKGKYADYWASKVRRNKQRDREVDQALQALGFRVIRIWEHDILANPSSAVQAIREAICQGSITF